METSHKFHIWIILLLGWNAILLILIMALLYFRPTPDLNSAGLATVCANAVQATLEDACVNL
ncbi:MAG: hypothetical protein WAZ14_00925 [Patescibacteria group bacterium]